jgi:hypothetical protein
MPILIAPDCSNGKAERRCAVLDLAEISAAAPEQVILVSGRKP